MLTGLLFGEESMDTIRRSVANNAAWVDMVMTSLGMPGQYTPVLWQNLHDMPPIFPNADTLDGTVDQQMRAIATLVERRKGRSVAIKDAWAQLDLGVLGFSPLFEALWIYREPNPMPMTSDIHLERIHTTSALREFAVACNGEELAHVYSSALLRPEIAWIAVRVDGNIVGGVTAVNAMGVNGINNLFATDSATEQALIQAAVNAFPNLPACGYERAEATAPYLELGFTIKGKLRVWVKPPTSV